MKNAININDNSLVDIFKNTELQESKVTRLKKDDITKLLDDFNEIKDEVHSGTMNNDDFQY